MDGEVALQRKQSGKNKWNDDAKLLFYLTIRMPRRIDSQCLTLSLARRVKVFGGIGGRGETVVGVMGVSLTGPSTGTLCGTLRHSTGDGRRSLKDVAIAVARADVRAFCCGRMGRYVVAGTVAYDRLSAEPLLWK